MNRPPWHWSGTELTLELHTQPRASHSEVVGLRDTHVKVRIAAPPVDGQANGELVKLLARELGVAKSQVRIVKGAGSRFKRVVVRAPRVFPAWLGGVRCQGSGPV